MSYALPLTDCSRRGEAFARANPWVLGQAPTAVQDSIGRTASAITGTIATGVIGLGLGLGVLAYMYRRGRRPNRNRRRSR